MEAGRAAWPPHWLPSILERPPPVSCPTSAKLGVLRAPLRASVEPPRRWAASTAPAGLLLQTHEFGPNSVAVPTWQSWGLYGCYGVYTWCLLDGRHVHPVTATHIGGHRQDVGDVGRSLPGCWPRVARASTDLLIIDRNLDGAAPALMSCMWADFAQLPLVYWRAPGDLFKGRLPSPVRNVTG